MGRAGHIWSLAAQVAMLALTALALAWAAIPAKPYQGLLLLLAVVAVVTIKLPAWRRSEAAALVGSLTLATACLLSTTRTWDLPYLADLTPSAYLPLLLPVLVTAAVALILWALIARAGLGSASRIGIPVLLGGVCLALATLGFYAMVHGIAAFNALYGFELNQLYEMLTATLLYPLALWLGGAGVRATTRWSVQSAGTAVLLLAFLVFWHVR
jgi:hypothetical protein